jgi:arylsulfate sulfotransferase
VRAQRVLVALAWIVGLVLLPALASEAATASEAGSQPAVISGVSLTPNLPSGQLVGTTVTWTATATDTVPVEYRFVVQFIGGPTLMARDFETGNSFTWTPIQEGYYSIQVTVQETPPGANPLVTVSSPNFRVVSRVTGGQPVVTATANPLVFLYSVSPCGTGTVSAMFSDGTSPTGYTITPPRACSTVRSTNSYLVGLRAHTTYGVRARYIQGTSVTLGPVTTFATGVIPSALTFPTISVPLPASAATSTKEAIVFHDTNGLNSSATGPHIFATDLSGNIVWYYNDPANPTHQYVDRPLPGGGVAALLGGGPQYEKIVRFFSPAGDPLQETSITRLNEQLMARMTTPPPAGQSCGSNAIGQTICTISILHHEINPMPNGHTILFGNVEKLFPPGTQGSTSGRPVDILTDQVMDLDQNLQIDWTWNTFDNLTISRGAVLNEKCVGPTGQNCTSPLQYANQADGTANDWTHTNAAAYSASDHNLILSMRNQDWILKIRYADATGDGQILWRLGREGDFTLQGAQPGETFPWFSHQHGDENVGSADRIVTFDNGNTRCHGAAAGTCDSRGQVYLLDEANLIATRIVNADMGNYSDAIGWGQSLSNGDYSFTSGRQSPSTGGLGADEEFSPNGTTETYAIQDQPIFIYRDYRLQNMYSGCCGE